MANAVWDPVNNGERKISEEDSRVALYVVPAEEDLMIARHVARMCRESPGAGTT